jgi:hypothetical protein
MNGQMGGCLCSVRWGAGMFVVVSDVDSKHGLSGCGRQWFSSSVVRWQSLRAVFARYGLLCYTPTGPSLVHIVRVGCDTGGFFHKEGPVRCRESDVMDEQGRDKFLIWKRSLIWRLRC